MRGNQSPPVLVIIRWTDYHEWWTVWLLWSALSWKCQELLRIEIWPPLLWPHADHHLGAGQGVSWIIFDGDQQLKYPIIISCHIWNIRWGAPSIRPLAPLSLHPASKVTSKAISLWAFCLTVWQKIVVNWRKSVGHSVRHNYSSHVTKGARTCKMHWYGVHPHYHCHPYHPHHHHHLGQVLHYAQEIYEGMKAYR